MKSLMEIYTPQIKPLLDFRKDLRQKLSSTLSSMEQETQKSEASWEDLQKMAVLLSNVFLEIHQLLSIYETVLLERVQEDILSDSMEGSSGSDQNIVH